MSGLNDLNSQANSAFGALSAGTTLRTDAGRLRMSNMASGSFQQALLNASAGERREATEVAAQQLVSSALIQPVLASMHESTFISEDSPFAPGTVEKRFAPMLDQYLSERITSASNFDLVRMIADKYAPVKDTVDQGSADSTAANAKEAGVNLHG